MNLPPLSAILSWKEDTALCGLWEQHRGRVRFSLEQSLRRHFPEVKRPWADAELDDPELYWILIQTLRAQKSDPAAARAILHRALSLEPNPGLDFESTVLSQSTQHQALYQGLTTDQCEIARQRYKQAVQLIAQKASPASRFIQTFAQHIVFRTNPAEKDFYSASHPSHVGRILLINAHEPELDVEALASALIHESVHSFLYILEESQPFLLFGNNPEKNLTSPWSGHPLCVHSFIHACFVWFALDQFWSRGETQTKGAFRELTAARRGFFQAGYYDITRSIRDRVQPDIVRSILGFWRPTTGLARLPQYGGQKDVSAIEAI